MKEIAEIVEPQQMAYYMGSPKSEKFLRPSGSKRQSRAVQNLIQNYTKYLEPSQMAEYICPAEIKEIAEKLMDEG